MFDNQGRQIETKYKVSNGKKNLFNPYHLRCSCLINGKNVSVFQSKDFPNILDMVEKKLDSNNVKMSEFNENVRCALQTEKVTTDTCDASQHEAETVVTTNDSVIFTDSPLVLPQISLFDSHISSTPKADDNKSVVDMLEQIQNGVDQLRSALQTHIKEAARQMTILRDEVHSIKSHITVHSISEACGNSGSNSETHCK